MSMKVLVVGGAGYVGGAVVDLLSQGLYDIHVYDSLLYEEAYRREVPFTRGDVRDWDRLGPLVQEADVIVWLAAIVGDGACQVNADEARSVNQASVEALSQATDARIIFMSTCSVYGAQQGVLTEESPTNPLSVYAETKVEAEAALANSNSLVFRLGTLFGVGDLYSRIRLDLVVNTLVARAHTRGALTVFGGDQFRPLLHVKDVARQIEGALTSEVTGVFNLGRQNIRIIDLAHQVRSHFPDVEMEVQDIPFEDQRNYRVRWAHAEEELGFEPHFTVDDGILEVKQLLLDRRIDVDNPRYSNCGFLVSKV
jgi:nucleoside-diphosphate-sugar epimerase